VVTEMIHRPFDKPLSPTTLNSSRFLFARNDSKKQKTNTSFSFRVSPSAFTLLLPRSFRSSPTSYDSFSENRKRS
jgi:hypothetical protein